MAVIAVPGTTANSYVSNTAAVALWSNDQRKQDYPTAEADQDRVLTGATTLLDDVYGESYNGEIHDTSFALYWPRENVTDPRTRQRITDFTTFPADIARATALQAYHLFKNDRQQESADFLSGIRSQELEGVGRIERASVSEQRSALTRPTIHPEVARIMAKWTTGGFSQYSSNMARG